MKVQCVARQGADVLNVRVGDNKTVRADKTNDYTIEVPKELGEKLVKSQRWVEANKKD